MKKIKQIILGEIGAGILLITIQIVVGINTDGSIPYILGSNIVGILGITSIIDGIRKLNRRDK